VSACDCTLIDPARGQLEAAMYEVVDALHHQLRGRPGWPGTRLDACARRELDALWGAMAALPEGHREWLGQPLAGRYPPAARVVAAWWSDYLGRRHVRIAGAGRADLAAALAPGPSRPPLAWIYPRHCVMVGEHRRYRLLVLCGCGAWGRPEEVAWMGPCCGPCADRGEGEPAPALGWRMGESAVEHLEVAAGRVACLDRAGRLEVREAPGGRLLDERASFPAAKLAVSPDGELVGLGAAARTEVIGPAGSWAAGEFPFAFAREGPALFLHDGRERLVLLDLPTRRARRFGVPHPLRLRDLAVSPDGRLLAGAAGPRGLYFWDVRTGAPIDRMPIGDCVGPLAFSPDGTFLAAAVLNRRRHVALYDVLTGRYRATLGVSADVEGFAFSPDGAWLVTAEEDTLRIWEVHTGLERRSLSPADGREGLGPVAFTPDGRFLLVGTSRGSVWLWPAEMLWPE
jgi:hypothetical protein